MAAGHPKSSNQTAQYIAPATPQWIARSQRRVAPPRIVGGLEEWHGSACRPGESSRKAGVVSYALEETHMEPESHVGLQRKAVFQSVLAGSTFIFHVGLFPGLERSSCSGHDHENEAEWFCACSIGDPFQSQ